MCFWSCEPRAVRLHQRSSAGPGEPLGKEHRPRCAPGKPSHHRASTDGPKAHREQQGARPGLSDTATAARSCRPGRQDGLFLSVLHLVPLDCTSLLPHGLIYPGQPPSARQTDTSASPAATSSSWWWGTPRSPSPRRSDYPHPSRCFFSPPLGSGSPVPPSSCSALPQEGLTPAHFPSCRP